MYPCVLLLSVALTLAALFFLHNTIQVHRSTSANTCRDEPAGEKTSDARIKLHNGLQEHSKTSTLTTSSRDWDLCPQTRNHQGLSQQTLGFFRPAAKDCHTVTSS